MPRRQYFPGVINGLKQRRTTMTLLKRTFTSITAKIDQLVGEIENHDALIQAAIKEQKKKIATAKVQLRRLQDSEHRLREQIAQLKMNERQWTDRASKEAGDDESKALSCLQRRQKIRLQLEKLTGMSREYQQSSVKVKANIAQCEDDLVSMMQKHQMLRARQSTAEAMQIIDRDGNANLDDIEASFDRWEIKIAQGEYLLDRFDECDELEQDYLSEENELELRAQLADLLKEEKLKGEKNKGGDDE